MSIQYLNKDLVLNNNKNYVIDRMFLYDIKYCIRKYCNFDIIDNYKLDYSFLRYGDIYGSTNPKYQKDNLYEILHALDDYDLKKYINYVMVMNGLQKPRNIMRSDHILCVKENDFLHVVKGNHRLILCKALYEITILITLNGFNNDKMFYGKVLIKK